MLFSIKLPRKWSLSFRGSNWSTQVNGWRSLEYCYSLYSWLEREIRAPEMSLQDQDSSCAVACLDWSCSVVYHWTGIVPLPLLSRSESLGVIKMVKFFGWKWSKSSLSSSFLLSSSAVSERVQHLVSLAYYYQVQVKHTCTEMSTNYVIVCLLRSQPIMYSVCISNGRVVVTSLSKHLGAPRMSNQDSSCADVCLDWICCHQTGVVLFSLLGWSYLVFKLSPRSSYLLEPFAGFKQEPRLTCIISISLSPSAMRCLSNEVDPLWSRVLSNCLIDWGKKINFVPHREMKKILIMLLTVNRCYRALRVTRLVKLSSAGFDGKHFDQVYRDWRTSPSGCVISIGSSHRDMFQGQDSYAWSVSSQIIYRYRLPSWVRFFFRQMVRSNYRSVSVIWREVKVHVPPSHGSQTLYIDEELYLVHLILPFYAFEKFLYMCVSILLARIESTIRTLERECWD